MRRKRRPHSKIQIRITFKIKVLFQLVSNLNRALPLSKIRLAKSDQKCVEKKIDRQIDTAFISFPFAANDELHEWGQYYNI